jgi:hypothetical protein
MRLSARPAGIQSLAQVLVLALNAAALVLAVVALARPQHGRVFEEIESHGWTSCSASTSPSRCRRGPPADRITAAKQRAQEFVSPRSATGSAWWCSATAP